jgi:hypothetical protein
MSSSGEKKIGFVIGEPKKKYGLIVPTKKSTTVKPVIEKLKPVLGNIFAEADASGEQNSNACKTVFFCLFDIYLTAVVHR